MKTTIALLSALLLAGCSESPKYLISYEVATKDQQIIRGTTIVSMPRLTEGRISTALAGLYQNPKIQTNGIVVLAIVKLESEGGW